VSYLDSPFCLLWNWLLRVRNSNVILPHHRSQVSLAVQCLQMLVDLPKVIFINRNIMVIVPKSYTILQMLKTMFFIEKWSSFFGTKKSCWNCHQVKLHGVRAVGDVVEVPRGGQDGAETLLGDVVDDALPVLLLPHLDDGFRSYLIPVHKYFLPN